MTKNELDALEIKQTRAKYGLSQQAFALLLGIGEASIVRYENGQAPTRANANLIRAAARPEFMLDCLERDGDLLAEAQFDKTSKIVYAMIRLDDEGEAMDINQIYMLTLEQEILNEKAARLLADLHRMQDNAITAGDEQLYEILEIIACDVALLKPTIVSAENDSKQKLAQLKGKFSALEHIAHSAVQRKVA